MNAPRTILASLAALLSVGPTLIVPIATWHHHGGGDCADYACCTAAADSHKSAEAAPTSREVTRVDSECFLCVIAGSIATDTLDAPPAVAPYEAGEQPWLPLTTQPRIGSRALPPSRGPPTLFVA